MIIRLQKFLSQAGVCSRRKGEVWIAEGRVCVNNEVVRVPGTKVDPDRDKVFVDGKLVDYTPEEPGIYIAMNKPRGVVTSCSHPGETIVLDLIDISARVFPVGRLDKDSTGLLLLTNDGELHNRMSHPSFDHEKEYVVKTVKPIDDQALAAMSRGMMLDGKQTRKADVRRLGPNSFRIVLKQGINRQIRRMVAQTGNRVSHLKRVRMGSILLGDLKPGAWRYLDDREIKRLTRPPRNSV